MAALCSPSSFVYRPNNKALSTTAIAGRKHPRGAGEEVSILRLDVASFVKLNAQLGGQTFSLRGHKTESQYHQACWPLFLCSRNAIESTRPTNRTWNRTHFLRDDRADATLVITTELGNCQTIASGILAKRSLSLIEKCRETVSRRSQCGKEAVA